MYEEHNRKIFSSSIILLILKLLLLGIFIFILCWLFISNRGEKKSNKVDSVFVTNINTMKDAAFEYFTTDNLPNTIGEAKKITLKQMLDDKLILDFTNNGKDCSLDESYIEATKTSDSKYALKVNLSCKKATDFIVTSLEKEEINCPTCQNQPTTNVEETENKNDNSPNIEATIEPNNSNNSTNGNSNNPSTTTKPKSEKTVYKYYDLQSNNNTTTTKNTMYEIYTYGEWNNGYQNSDGYENTCSKQETYEYCKIGSLTRYVSYYLSDAYDNREYSTSLYVTKLDYKSVIPYETTSSYFTSLDDYKALIKQLNTDHDDGRNFIKNAEEMMAASLGAQNFTFKTSDVYRNGLYFKIDLTINVNNHNNVKPLYTDYLNQNIYFAPVKYTIKYKLINTCVNDTLANMNQHKYYKMFDNNSNECKNRQKITKWVSAKELFNYLENGWIRTGNTKDETI